MEKEEAAEILRQIDAEYDQEHDKLVQQRKQIADVNRVISLCLTYGLEYHCDSA